MAVKQNGFTLLELLVVIAVIALGTAGVALAMRDGNQTLIEREAVRLAALLDAARGQSRASGVRVTWDAPSDGKPTMRWTGLRNREPLPNTWLDAQVQVIGSAQLVLGPEPVITPQQVRLQMGNDTRLIVTDGVSAFRVVQP